MEEGRGGDGGGERSCRERQSARPCGSRKGKGQSEVKRSCFDSSGFSVLVLQSPAALFKLSLLFLFLITH